MNEKLTEVVFIIDESGSMHGLEADTIGGFNSNFSISSIAYDAFISILIPLKIFIRNFFI